MLHIQAGQLLTFILGGSGAGKEGQASRFVEVTFSWYTHMTEKAI